MNYQSNDQRGSKGRIKVKESKRASLLFCGVLSAIVLLTAGGVTLTTVKHQAQFVSGVQSMRLSSGWTDSSGNVVTLPEKVSYPQGGSYTLYTVVPNPDVANQDMSILFSAKYLNVKLFLDGEEIGGCTGRPKGGSKIVGKTFFIVDLPADAVGKELRMEAVPLLGKDMQYEISAPLIGTGERLIYDLIKGDLPMLIIIEAIFCFGLLLMLFSIQARKTGNGTFFQTGMFAILFALYSLSITDTIHLFFGHPQFIYLMEFLLLALCPLPLLVLVYNVCLPKFHRLLQADISIVTLNFCLQTILYFFTGLELRDTIWVTHLILVLSLLALVPILGLSGRQGGERFRLLVSFSPVLLGASWDIGRFYLPGTYQKAVGFQLGVLLFIFMQTIYLVGSYLESDLYKKVAYTDALTGLLNRTAFEERIEQLSKSAAHYSSIWCVCADVNCLKKVNDTLGHSAGDNLIRSAGKVLWESKSKDSDLYRTGGDEFVLFAFNQSQESMEQGRARFEAILRSHNQTHDVPLSIALGYDRLLKGDSITALISRADAIMYNDKHLQKEGLDRIASYQNHSMSSE